MTKGKSRRDLRDAYLRRVYGISLFQYESLLKKQGDSCAVCLKPKDTFKTNLAVDHNHVTGEIRGLLCNYCNRRLIGRHRDSSLLLRMADYVAQGTGLFVPAKKKKKRKRRVRHRKSH
jgi:hypothetical protein